MKKKNDPKLKPCPFCGGVGRYMTIDEEEDNPHAGGEFIECLDCHASTSIMFPTMDSVDELVIEKWNNRESGKPEPVERNEQITLLEAFAIFLEKEGYLDTDWRTEPPYAIDEFLKTITKKQHG